MKQKHLLLALPLLILMACTQEDPVVVPQTNEQPMEVNEHRVPLKEALKRADALLSQIGDPATRSKTRKVKSVDYLTNTLTRSGAIDTTLYLVNYENNGGFALLGADERVRPIYAISDEGRLCMSDTIENKGLALFFRNAEAEIANTPLIPEIEDSLIYIGPPEIDPPYHEVVVYRQVEPLLGMYQRLWGQGAPYNMYCPNNFPAGCVAVATVQIMSYYQWPSYIGSETFPWQAMNAGRANERVAKLLRIIGDRLNMNYGPGGSGANSNDVNDVLDDLGYNHVPDLQDFNEILVSRILEGNFNGVNIGTPVLVRGKTSNNKGHAWVIDGFVQYKTISNMIVGGEQLHDILHHCVWGWYGNSNGYFYWAPTNSFSGNPIEEDIPGQSNSDINDNPFVKDLKYMGGFIPNR